MTIIIMPRHAELTAISFDVYVLSREQTSGYKLLFDQLWVDELPLTESNVYK